VRTPSFTLKQLNYFVTAARLGKIATAAIELNISQSAITTAILDLENQLGAELLDRHPGGVTLTYRGQMFMAHAENILGAANDAQRAPFRADATAEGVVRVHATYVVCGYFLLPVIAKVRRLYPKIEIVLNEAPRQECERALKSGEADIAVLLTSNLADSDGLESQRALRSRRQLWVGSGSALLQKTEVSLYEVRDLPYVFLQVDDGEKVTRSYWQKYGLEPNVQFRTASMEALREWIALGMGVTIVADIVFRPWSLDGRKIERIPIFEGVPSMDIGLAWRRGADLSPAAVVLKDFVMQASCQIAGVD